MVYTRGPIPVEVFYSFNEPLQISQPMCGFVVGDIKLSFAKALYEARRR